MLDDAARRRQTDSTARASGSGITLVKSCAGAETRSVQAINSELEEEHFWKVDQIETLAAIKQMFRCCLEQGNKTTTAVQSQQLRPDLPGSQHVFLSHHRQVPVTAEAKLLPHAATDLSSRCQAILPSDG